MKNRTKRRIATIFSAILLLVLWQVLAMVVNQPEFFPSVPRLLATLFELFLTGNFYLSIGATILRGIVGMFISLLFAAGLAGLFARYEWLYELFRPLLTVMRSVPVISFILLALIFLHAESIPLLIGFLTMFPLLTENLTKGISNQRVGLSVMAKQFCLSRRNRFTQIFYPQLKPFLYSGLASAAGFGWRAIIMGEVLSQCSFGIGSEMKRAQTFIAVPELLAWTLMAIIISYLTDKGISWLSQRKLKISFVPSKSANGKEYFLNEFIIQTLPIEVNDVSYKYGISHFTYSFEAGKIYGISAPSGAGKTTLLNLINGTLHPTTGKIEIDRTEGIASIFQEPELTEHLNILENTVLPLARLKTKEDAFILASNMLCSLEMEDFMLKYPNELSYGQQQRAAMARALVYPSSFLFMDEPFKGLDEALSKRIIEHLQQRQTDKKQTILFTSHQTVELSLFSEKVVYL